MIEDTLEVICQGRLFFKLYLLSLQYLNFYLKASMVAFGKVHRALYLIFNIFFIEFTLSRSVRTVAYFHFTEHLTDRGYVFSGSDTHLR